MGSLRGVLWIGFAVDDIRKTKQIVSEKTPQAQHTFFGRGRLPDAVMPIRDEDIVAGPDIIIAACAGSLAVFPDCGKQAVA